MNIYTVETVNLQMDCTAYDIERGCLAAEYSITGAVVVAPTRGKARALFCEEFALDFIEPLTIIKRGVSDLPENVYLDLAWGEDAQRLMSFDEYLQWADAQS